MAASRRMRLAVPILAGIFIGVAALAGFGIYAVTHKNTPAPEAAPAVQADAPRMMGALPETALTITTDPVGAAVRVDGVDRGASPVTLRIPKGHQVTIDVHRVGYEPAQKVAAMEHDTQAIALTLRPTAPPAAPDASPPDASPSINAPLAPPIKRPSNRGSGEPRRPGSASTFNPDDAVGDE